MTEFELTAETLEEFSRELLRQEKSPATREKYLRDCRKFLLFLGGEKVTKERTVAYKGHLMEAGYAVRSVNSMLASVNALLTFLNARSCHVRSLRQQKQVYSPEDRELTQGEYRRLLDAARKNPQLNLLLQTICSTGIRVSELRYFTVEAVRQGEVVVRCKGKTRVILLPQKLRDRLLAFAEKAGISSGPIFLGRKGTPLSRGSIWARMKALCGRAGVKPGKVFPHNLRKLFARTFYAAQRDIAMLADVLGHSSINTTRIYIMSTGAEHRHRLDRLNLVI